MPRAIQILRENLQARLGTFVSSIDGQAGIAIHDLTNSDIAASFQAGRPFPSASVIKIAIACAAVDARNLGAIDFSETVQVRELDDTVYCSVLAAFQPTDRLSLHNLMGLMLITSDNAATTALLKRVGRHKINSWLDRHGLSPARIEIGFEDANLGDPLRVNQITANQAISLLEIINDNEDYAEIRHMLTNNLRSQRLPKRLPDHVEVAHKTGSLNGVVNDIGIIKSPEANYMIAVLSYDIANTPTFETALAEFSKDVYELIARG